MPEQMRLFTAPLRDEAPVSSPEMTPFGPVNALSPFQFRNVALGLHPSGEAMGARRGDTCGHCVMRERDGSCARFGTMKHGPGTQVKSAWSACSSFVPLTEDAA